MPTENSKPIDKTKTPQKLSNTQRFLTDLGRSVGVTREKDRDLTQSYDENPYTNRKFNNQLTTQKRHQNVDHTTITDQTRTDSWSNNPIGVVTDLRVPNLPTNH